MERDNNQDPAFMEARVVVGVGAQKTGTTSIANFLRQNNVGVVPQKELHAFRVGQRFVSRREYLGLIDFRTDGRIYGEFTPNYIHRPSAIWNLAQIVPEAKIIMSLRNPVDRAFSAYKHAVGIGAIGQHQTFEDVIEQSKNGVRNNWVTDILRLSFYARDIERLLSFFPRKQIFFLDFEHLRDETKRNAVSVGLLDFVGAPQMNLDLPKVNQSNKYTSLIQPASKVVDKSTRTALEGVFYESVRATEKLIGFQLDWWKN